MRLLLVLFSLAVMAGGVPVWGQIRFHETALARGLKGGYQVIAADLNKDGKPDLIALASGMPELVWFENPSWERHVIAGGLSRMINVAALDVNGDGVPELLVTHAFENVAKKSVGIVSLLESQGDVRQLWKVREIDRLTTSHRIRAVRLQGGGVAFVNAPLTGAEAVAPDYRDRIPVVRYRPHAYQREVVSDMLQGVMHGIYVTDWDRDGVEDLLTASFEGVHVMRPSRLGATPEKLLAGSPAAWPLSGSSEIVVGLLGPERFLATIDPWHGNQVAVWRQRAGAGVWHRTVVDDSEADGHTLHAADLTGDGRDEVIAGFRGPGRTVYYYEAQKDGTWRRWAIDRGGIAAAGCAVADFDGDKRMDVACIGSATANLKLYRNLGDPARRK